MGGHCGWSHFDAGQQVCFADAAERCGLSAQVDGGSVVLEFGDDFGVWVLPALVRLRVELRIGHVNRGLAVNDNCDFDVLRSGSGFHVEVDEPCGAVEGLVDGTTTRFASHVETESQFGFVVQFHVRFNAGDVAELGDDFPRVEAISL